MKLIKILLMLSFVLQSVNSMAAKWDRHNDPKGIEKFDRKAHKRTFSEMEKEGELYQKPWTDDYWATYQKGLAHRWQLDKLGRPYRKKDNFSREQLYKMQNGTLTRARKRRKHNHIMGLSPAEKYDIACGRYDFPLYNAEMKRYKETKEFWKELDKENGEPYNEENHTWEGLCHGWASAAMKFEEPDCLNYQNNDGIKIPFASSDIKALLTIMQGNYKEPGRECMVGTRCYDKFDAESFDSKGRTNFNDINAGAFHIILANRLGQDINQGFVFDRTTDAEVWNQPVESFEILEEKHAKKFNEGYGPRARGTDREVKLKVRVDYTSEIEPHVKAQNDGDRSDFVVSRFYDYVLELNKKGQIIGGRWITPNFPDFIWDEDPGKFKRLINDEGVEIDFSILGDIYRKATKKQ